MIEELLTGITSGDARFVMEDHEHICDTKTNLRYHLYDMASEEPMHISHPDYPMPIAIARDFSTLEMQKFDEVKRKLESLVTQAARSKLQELYVAT